jgi:hypothetical protein
MNNNASNQIYENKHAEHGAAVAKRHPIIGAILRFSGWWFGFSALYGTFAVCPFCGQSGCPVGAGSSGLIGGFLALCMQNWKAIIGAIHHKFTGIKVK